MSIFDFFAPKSKNVEKETGHKVLSWVAGTTVTFSRICSCCGREVHSQFPYSGPSYPCSDCLGKEFVKNTNDCDRLKDITKQIEENNRKIENLQKEVEKASRGLPHNFAHWDGFNCGSISPHFRSLQSGYCKTYYLASGVVGPA